MGLQHGSPCYARSILNVQILTYNMFIQNIHLPMTFTRIFEGFCLCGTLYVCRYAPQLYVNQKSCQDISSVWPIMISYMPVVSQNIQELCVYVLINSGLHPKYPFCVYVCIHYLRDPPWPTRPLAQKLIKPPEISANCAYIVHLRSFSGDIVK